MDNQRDDADFGGDYARDTHRGGYGDDYARDGSWTGRPSFRGRGPKNWRRSDERIRELVVQRLTDDHDVDASDIEVTVQDGEVTLSGNVASRFQKRAAEDVAESCPHVRDVHNRLQIA